MTSTSLLFLVAAVLCAAAVAEEPEPRGHYPTHGVGWQQQPQYPVRYPYPHPCTYRCTLRLCDLYQCHYKCVRGATCPVLGDLDARKGGAEITVSKPLSEKVDSFDYVPK
ncbi:hypothetical protein HPB50_017966 [Hyalomma asiaticum]|uniref:Uncharacterized protein n=1 Tax=Hyalomma asiaticum TaxID=266040 RepID=A0ACB7T8H9_HYAAI|nr:hypothetical protein HPB50_017966 [Hyalomma asiaticum]